MFSLPLFASIVFLVLLVLMMCCVFLLGVFVSKVSTYKEAYSDALRNILTFGVTNRPSDAGVFDVDDAKVDKPVVRN